MDKAKINYTSFSGKKPEIYKRYLKRPLDLIFSSIALVILAPFLFIIALVVKYKLGSPVIFTQERLGRGEKPFKVYKLRSMTMERDESGKLLPDAERITPFGRFLRATSIDELPSLWNVIKGDMSLIGPRPLPAKYLTYYTTEERRRHEIRGGLSGLAQVNGRNSLSWEERFAYDIKYLDSITFWGDVKIFVKTIKKVLKGSDIGLRGVTAPRALYEERDIAQKIEK